MRVLPIYLSISLAFLCLSSGTLMAEDFHVAEPVVIRPDAADTAIDATKQVLHYIDASKELKLQDVLQRSSRFRLNSEPVINLGVIPEAVWMQFTVHPAIDKPGPYMWELYYPLLDRIDLYIESDQGTECFQERCYEHIVTGDTLPLAKRNIKSRIFVERLQLEPGMDIHFVIRMESKGALQAPMTIQTYNHHLETEKNFDFIQGMYYGIMVALILYNMFLLFGIKDLNYLYYILYITGFGLFQAVYHGYAFLYLWPQNPELGNIMSPFLIAWSIFWASGFTRGFLHTKKTLPWADKALLTIQVLLAVVMVLTPVVNYRIVVSIGIISASVFVILAAMSAFWRWAVQSYRPARFFLLAWTAWLAGVLLMSAKQYGLLPYGFFTNYSFQIGSAMEVILLSVALADRIKTIEAEKNEALEVAYSSLERANHIKDQFLFNTSLQLRRPIEAVIGVAEAMLEVEGDSLSESARSDLRLITRTGLLSSGMVGDMLDFYRIKNQDLALNLRVIAVPATVGLVLELMRPSMRAKGIKIEKELPYCEIRADEERFKQIVYNILRAIVHSSGEGRLFTELIPDRETVKLQITYEGSGDYAGLKDRFYLFESGNLSEKELEAGPGLAIVEKLITMHGGTLQVDESEAGRISILIEMPAAVSETEIDEDTRQMLPAERRKRLLAEGKEEQLSLNSAHFNAATGGRSFEARRIVIIDPDEASQRLMTQRLKGLAGRIQCFSRATEALISIRNSAPDLLITDMNLPDFNGLEICRAVRDLYELNELPVLMIGSRVVTAELVAAIEAGANDYLARPVDQASLISRSVTLLTLRESMERQARLIEIDKELGVARKIINRLLPQKLSVTDPFSVHVLYNPAGTIGGDIYDLLPGEDGFGIMVADVTGHGVPAAVLASIVQVAFRMHRDQLKEPAALLNSLNGSLVKQLGGNFVTVGYCSFENNGKLTVTYGRAGHLPLKIYRKQTDEFITLNPGGKLLGLVDQANVTEESFELMKGDRVLLFTDGLQETLLRDRSYYGDSEMLETVRQHSDRSAAELITSIEQRVSELETIPRQLQDDRTLVVIDIS